MKSRNYPKNKAGGGLLYTEVGVTILERGLL